MLEPQFQYLSEFMVINRSLLCITTEISNWSIIEATIKHVINRNAEFAPENPCPKYRPRPPHPPPNKKKKKEKSYLNLLFDSSFTDLSKYAYLKRLNPYLNFQRLKTLPQF